MNTVMLVILEIIFILNAANDIKFSNSANAIDIVCEDNKVECVCGTPPNEEIRTFELDKDLATPLDLKVANCSNIPERTIFCANMTCSLYNYTSTPPKLPDNRSKRSRDKNSHFPVKLVLPPGGMAEASGHQRLRRFPKTCNDSLKPLKDAEITCWYWDSYVTCDVDCVHGYAIKEDGKTIRKTVRSCRETEKYWIPKATFPVCEPYMNCKAVLIKPGDLQCQTSMKSPTYCEISCFADVEHEDIPKKRYECVDDNFSKILPHCAKLDKKVALIAHPKI